MEQMFDCCVSFESEIVDAREASESDVRLLRLGRNWRIDL